MSTVNAQDVEIQVMLNNLTYEFTFIKFEGVFGSVHPRACNVTLAA